MYICNFRLALPQMPSGDRDWSVFGRPGHRIIGGRPGMHPTRSPGPALRPICIGDDSPGPLSAVLPQEATHPAVLFLQVLPPAARTRLHRRACQDRRPILPHLPDLCPSGSRSHPHRARHCPSPGAGPGVSCRPPSGSRPLQRPARHPRNAATGCRSAGCSTPQRAPTPQKPQGRGPIRRPGLGGSNPAGLHNRPLRGEPEIRQCQGFAGCNARSCPCNLHRWSAGVARVFRISVWSRTGSPSSGLALHRVTRCRPSNT